MADDSFSDEEEGGLLDRIKESPRTVSALIIILIVAAAIYAFSGEEKPVTDVNSGDTTADESPALSPALDEVFSSPAVGAGEVAAVPPMLATPEAVSQEELSEQTQVMPQVTVNEAGYVESAQTGDGITHLARRATTRWLAENQAGYTVTNEHRIYIEDYIQNKIGSEGLAIGATRTISFDLIAEAVAAAGQLNNQQLHNLSKYTSALK